MTLNCVLALILRYFTEFVYSGKCKWSVETLLVLWILSIKSSFSVVLKQLLGVLRFQNLLLIVYDHINAICAIIQRLSGQNKL